MKPVSKIVLIYAAFAALWILVSDGVLHFVIRDPNAFTLALMVKGWLFIAFTSLLLYGLISRFAVQVADGQAGLVRVEREKVRTLRLLEAIADSSHDAIFAKDAAGRYLLFNRGAAHMSGRDPAEVLGRDDTAVFPLEVAARIMADDREVMATGREVTYEENAGTAAGEFTFLVTKGALRDGDGQVMGVFGISRDITLRKQAEEAMRLAKEQAELANRAKTEFLAMISHELRTPLNAVIGFSDLVLVAEGDGIRCRDYVADIRAAGLHLLELVDDLLDVVSIEAGRVRVLPENVDTDRLVEAVLRLIRPRAEAKGVHLAVDVAAAPPLLRVGERQMKQILANLLGNAIKFTPEGGAVTLAIAPAADGGVTLRVADTGIGMDAEGVATALTFFGQVDASLARRYDGSGIGLPLSQRLAECHGGSLKVESAPGQGTTVTVHLPAECVVEVEHG
jgi:PAS domain S-box-containing protein